MATGPRARIILASAFAALGLLSVGFVIWFLVQNPQRPDDFALGILLLVMAAQGILFLVMAAQQILLLVKASQIAVGVSKKAPDWLFYAFVLVLGGAFLPQIVESVDNVLSRSILTATALVMLLVVVGWRLRHSRRRSHPS